MGVAIVPVVRAQPAAPPPATSPAPEPAAPPTSAPSVTQPQSLEIGDWSAYHSAFDVLYSGQRDQAQALLKLIRGRGPSAAAERASAVEQTLSGGPLPVVAPGEDETWNTYHTAFVLLAARRTGEANEMLQSLSRRRDGHPAVARAAALLSAPVGRARRPRYRAQERLEQPPERGDVIPSYGRHILIADLAWFTVAMVGNASDVEALSILGGLGYLALAPIVHALKGPGARTASSFGLRLLAPIVGGVVGLAVSCGARVSCEPAATNVPFTVSAGFGALAAIIGDAAVLARPRIERGIALGPAGLAFVPSLALVPGGGTMGLAARF